MLRILENSLTDERCSQFFLNMHVLFIEQVSHFMPVHSVGRLLESPITAVTDFLGNIRNWSLQVSPILRAAFAARKKSACNDNGRSPYPGLNLVVINNPRDCIFFSSSEHMLSQYVSIIAEPQQSKITERVKSRAS